jgi:DNA-binding NarL/FixJ family response regulator
MKRILIVDDNPAVRRSLRNLLEYETGWEVCCECKNGMEAIVKAEQLQPDVVILDMSLPVMNGLSTAKELKKVVPNVSLLMFTAFTTSQLEEAALGEGIRSVSSKSEAGALIECVHNALKPIA